MRRKSGYAKVNGASLYYEIAGHGPALALLHGFSLDTRMWDAQFGPFAARNRVLRYDLRGFGRSGAPSAEPYAPVEDLRALLDHLEIEQAAILGLSMGGGVAVDFALAYPQRTRALIPVDSTLSGYRWSIEWDLRAKEVGVTGARQRWLEHGLFAACREKPPAYDRLRQIVSGYSGWHWVNRDPGLPTDPPAIQRLEEIRAPTLVIAGERELPDFLEVARILARRIPGARLVLLPDAGHMANLEAPEAFNAAVIRFLDELEQ
jgi:pimeloyl-ACP methyl ester carboxylesterase